eukprot:1585842-Rhodomonas_salina.1
MSRGRALAFLPIVKLWQCPDLELLSRPGSQLHGHGTRGPARGTSTSTVTAHDARYKLERHRGFGHELALTTVGTSAANAGTHRIMAPARHCSFQSQASKKRQFKCKFKFLHQALHAPRIR